MCWGPLVPGLSLRSLAQATCQQTHPRRVTPDPLSQSWCRGALPSARCEGPSSSPRLCRDRNIEGRTGSEVTCGPQIYSLLGSGEDFWLGGLGLQSHDRQGPRRQPPETPGSTAHARPAPALPAGRCLGCSRGPSGPVPPGHCPRFPTSPTASALRRGAGPSPRPPSRHPTA